MKRNEKSVEEAIAPYVKRIGDEFHNIILAIAQREAVNLIANQDIARLDVKSKKRRGRPPKPRPSFLKPEAEDNNTPVEFALKRKRGRPPKLKVSPQDTLKGQKKRGPGRPRKVVAETAEAAPVKRGPGRPRKVLPAAPPEEAGRGRSAEEQADVEGHQRYEASEIHPAEVGQGSDTE